MYVRAVHTIKELRYQIQAERKARRVIGLIPTMGALHLGHARLVETARRDSDIVVVTIFVNPLQFGPSEDYGRYPRAYAQDLELCTRAGADVVFAPALEQMYPLPQLTLVEVTKIGDHLCGASRAGHFRGVATVVLKLFNIVSPDQAYFGEKDAQQLALIRRMVADLNVPVRIIGVPTVRESDGLAISSRNQYLNQEERQVAPILYRALREAERRVMEGESKASVIRETASEVLRESPLVKVEYVEVVDPEEMQPIAVITAPVRIAAAVWLGSTRLIDNVLAEISA
jgi:pantoate--beta-alanine ligase